jgi:hypothetical protein
MVQIQIVSYQNYRDIIGDIVGDTNIPTLVGNETIYPEDFLEPFIETFINSETAMKNYYFNITNKLDDLSNLNIYLQPKYTFNNAFNEIMGCNCIIVSEEIFEQYFQKQQLDNMYDFNMVYNIPAIDIISLKRISGDFPQDNSIDLLLTNYLESCIIINYLQEFTLHFYSNIKPFKNYIKFQISNITYKTESTKNADNRIEERIEEINLTIELNKQFNKKINNLEYDIGLNDCCNKVINFSWHDCNSDKPKVVGLVANNEVKIDFIVTELSVPSITPEPEMPLQKAMQPNPINDPNVNKKTVFANKGIVLNESESKPLTKEEVRMKRLMNLTK